MKMLNMLCTLLFVATAHTKVVEVDGQQDLENKIENNAHVVIKFYKPNCPACKKIAHDFEQLSNKIKDVLFLGINTNRQKNKTVYPAWKVRGVPAFFFVKDGNRSQEIKRKGNFARSFEQDIRNHFNL